MLRRGPNVFEGDLDADFGFTGHHYHDTSDLHLALFRGYDAESGRWISRDPIAEIAGFNVYTYVGQNPINIFDPFGLEGYWSSLLQNSNPLNSEGSFYATATSIGESSGGMLAYAWAKVTGNKGLADAAIAQIGNAYAGSVLGQTECAGKLAKRSTRAALAVSAAAVGIATGAGLWSAAGLPTMSIGWATPSRTIHFFWSVTTKKGTVVLHSVGVSSATGGIWAGYLSGSTAITGIPILFPGAAGAIGITGYNCFTGACAALRRGLLGF